MKQTISISLVVFCFSFVTANAADYFVLPGSPASSDANAGDEGKPFKTIEKACSIAVAGDVVHLGAGIYRETLTPKNSGEQGKPIRFVAVPGEKVVLSGTELLSGEWQKHDGNIYKLSTQSRFIQLFVDGKMMPEARWPNASGDLMEMKRGVAGEGTGYERLADSNLPPGDWNGAIVIFWPGSEWVNTTRRVADYQPGTSFAFDRTTEMKNKDPYHKEDPYKPRKGNPYLLVGSLAGLDSPGEWFLDDKAGVVYLWPPDGKAPETHTVEVKARDYACELSKLGFIEVKGADIFGAAVNMTNSHDCVLDDCRLRYVEHVRDYDGMKLPPVRNHVTGQNNVWRNCLVAYGATTALSIGGTNNALVNSVVHDSNYLGTGRGGVDLQGSVGARVSHCSVFRTGRDAIFHSSSKHITIEYNDVFQANLLNDDAGGIYSWGRDTIGGTIAYNWVHDNPHANGIYLDNFTTHFSVHHNLVWNCGGDAFHINCDALDHLVCNNTAFECRRFCGTYTFTGYTPTMKGMRVVNNLVIAAMNPKDPQQFVQGELGPEISHNGQGGMDRDGYPTADSSAIDAGVVVAGINEDFKGKAPDLGAYESGGTKWTAGADRKDAEVAPPPAKNLQYEPAKPITEQNMIQNGLVLWLDANDAATFDLSTDGTVRAWNDKSPAKHVASPANTSGAVKRVVDGLAGKPVVRGNGLGELRITTLHRGPGALTVLVVSQASETAGPPWQRLIACSTGAGKEWEQPNWNIVRAGGATPAAYPPQLFTVLARDRSALGKLAVLGAADNPGQCLAGDVAEILIFDRALKFDEYEAVEKYLTVKWALPRK